MQALTSVSLKATPWKVEDLAVLKREGKICLPDLQRGFVWSADRVRGLHDSLYRRYPVGALLLWKPAWQDREAPVATRSWEIFPPDPATGRGTRDRDSTVLPGSLFVLDGQQRLTSLFRVLFRSRIKDKTAPDPDLLVSLSPAEEWVNNPFHLRSRGILRKMKDGLLVPAEVLFERVRGGEENLAIQRAIGEWLKADDPLFFKALDRANAVRTAILQAEIIAYEIDADGNDDNVIEIFARLNQQGVRLRPSDLAAARLTGRMADFRSRARSVLQAPNLAGFSAPEGKEEVGRTGGLVDTDLLIRASVFLGAGVVSHREVESRGPQGAAYGKVEAHWDAAARGLVSAVQLFRDAGIPGGTWLPYRYILLPPAIAAASGHQLGPQWLSWAILASLWPHYAGSVETTLQKDCGLAQKGDVAGLIDHVKIVAKRVDTAIPEEEDFVGNIVNESGVLLALLVHFARSQGRSFPGRKLLAGADEPLEVHHVFPRAILDSDSGRTNEFVPDRLGNLTLLTRSDNEHLGDTSPRDYLPTIGESERTVHLIPNDAEVWKVESFPEFCRCREAAMAKAMRDLLSELLSGDQNTAFTQISPSHS